MHHFLDKFDLNIALSILSVWIRALSILNAKIASFTFLLRLTSLVNKKFLATCCVIVEAPSSLFEEIIFEILFITALKPLLHQHLDEKRNFYLLQIKMS